MDADLHGMAPALFVTSTRDMLLSGTALLHRAYLRAGVDARLVVFEGLPHAFWNDVALPESREAYGSLSASWGSDSIGLLFRPCVLMLFMYTGCSTLFL